MDATDRRLATLATIKDGDKCKCCPECGAVEFKQAFDGERECKGCGQSWYADIAYRHLTPEPECRCDTFNQFLCPNHE